MDKPKGSNITQQLSFDELDKQSGAIFSPCRKYRYTLWRFWDCGKPYAVFLCLNPSTADEINNDPTIRRCIDFSKQWGYGGVVILNIFAYRATDPEVMKEAVDPIGPDNDKWLKEITQHPDAGITVAAWGNHGDFADRGKQVLSMLGDMYCLKVNSNGQPAHPLYLKKSLKPHLLLSVKTG